MKLSKEIENIFLEMEGRVTIQKVLSKTSYKSFGLLLVVFSIPSALPVPAPGYSIPFGVILLLIGVQIFLSRPYPWFPMKILEKEFKLGDDPKFVKAMVKFLRFFEKFLKPRLGQVYNYKFSYAIIGAAISLCALSMMIPIPLTNTIPALGVLMIGLGMLEEDGFFGGLGVVTCLAGVLFTCFLLVLIYLMGWQAIDLVKDWFRVLIPV
jgi:hypothetical protein